MRNSSQYEYRSYSPTLDRQQFTVHQYRPIGPQTKPPNRSYDRALKIKGERFRRRRNCPTLFILEYAQSRTFRRTTSGRGQQFYLLRDATRTFYIQVTVNEKDYTGIHSGLNDLQRRPRYSHAPSLAETEVVTHD
jgi:hypothetical protein